MSKESGFLRWNLLLVKNAEMTTKDLEYYIYTLTWLKQQQGLKGLTPIFYLFIYLLIMVCVGSLLLCTGLLQLWQAGATLRCGARASHCGGFPCCGARTLGKRAQQLWHTDSRAQAQQLWRTGLVAPWHVGSSQTRARTRVPCIARWILNLCATREVPPILKEVLV